MSHEALRILAVHAPGLVHVPRLVYGLMMKVCLQLEGGELESFFPFYDILIKKPRGVKHDALCLRCLLVSPNVHFETKKSINYIHPLEKIYT